jgi:DNA-binding Xre family transcriptional regulator
MKPCYDKLWHTCIDKRIRKMELTRIADISTSTLYKLSHEKWVSLEVISRLCKVLDCTPNDIVSFEEGEVD